MANHKVGSNLTVVVAMLFFFLFVPPVYVAGDDNGTVADYVEAARVAAAAASAAVAAHNASVVAARTAVAEAAAAAAAAAEATRVVADAVSRVEAEVAIAVNRVEATVAEAISRVEAEVADAVSRVEAEVDAVSRAETGDLPLFIIPVFIVTASLALLGLAGFILSLVSLRKIRIAVKKLEGVAHKQKNKLEEQERKLDEQYADLINRLKQDRGFVDNEVKNEVKNLRRDLEKATLLESSVSKLDNKLEQLTQAMHASDSRNIQQEVLPKDYIVLFNSWAKEPQAPLPKAFFYYVAADPKKRFDSINVVSSFSETPTKWIANKTDDKQSKQYLFPNPNFFDEGFDTRLYGMKNTCYLQARGENKIIIITACEIQDNEIISRGELEVLA